MKFEELLNDDQYDWGGYFYRLETKKRTRLEDALFIAYHRYKGTRSVDICCCDTSPRMDCGPDCCMQVQCSHCHAVIRICKDAWFCTDTTVSCMQCH